MLFLYLLHQILVYWSRVTSAFCCRLNRLVLDDRSKILTTSGEKLDAQPWRERRRPDWSTGLHRGDAPLDKGRAMPHSAGRPGKDFSVCLILMSLFVCSMLEHCVGQNCEEAPYLCVWILFYVLLENQIKHSFICIAYFAVISSVSTFMSEIAVNIVYFDIIIIIIINFRCCK